MPKLDDQIQRIEAAIRTDPARRGLLQSPQDPLGWGELARAAESLAASATRVLIVTGFYIPSARPPAAETDGPPGSIALAEVLTRLGIESTLMTDRFCASAVAAGMSSRGRDPKRLRIFETDDEIQEKRLESLQNASHLIAIERAGPTYDSRTMARLWGDDARRDFESTTSPDLWSRPLNMRGRPIDDWTLDFSPLFENAPPGLTTIGIGDGGNEIGMGKFPWPTLARRLRSTGYRGPSIVSRVSCDHTIIAGNSNWGAWGLAAALALTRGLPSAFAQTTLAGQHEILEAMVQNGPAVDGVTGCAEPTVDGLSLEEYGAPLEVLRSIM